jgi:splicing factor 3B subunit 2
MRERIQPKMGKIEIDYNVLHDAFFKHQKQSKLSKHGSIYYEGMENEV